MQTRFHKNAKVFDIGITSIAATISVGVMLYGIGHFGLQEAWPELVLNLFYIACLVMIGMYFFNYRITTQQFNYWCSISVGMTVLLRDILFPPPLISFHLHLACLTLSVLLLCTLTFFMHVRNGRVTPSATYGLSASSTYSLPHYIISISIWNPLLKAPTIC